MSRVIGMYVCNAVSSCQRRLAQSCARKSLTDLEINMSRKAHCGATAKSLSTTARFDERKPFISIRLKGVSRVFQT